MWIQGILASLFLVSLNVDAYVNFTTPEAGSLFSWGVLFEEFDQIQASKEEWLHTLVIGLPIPQAWPNVVVDNCEDISEESLCTNTRALQEQLQNMKENTERIVNENINLLKSAFPNDQNYEGPGTKSGYSTDHLSLKMSSKDLHTLQDHLNNVHAMNDDIPNSFHVHNMPFSSVMKHHLANVDKLTNSIVQNHQDLMKYASYSSDILRNYSAIIATVFETQEVLNEIENDACRLADAFLMLKINRLHPNLISPSDISSILTGVQAELDEKYPGFSLVFNNVDHIYNTPITLVQRKGNSIHITLQIPISEPATMLQSWRVRTVPVQENGLVSHYTVIKDILPYFLVSRDGSLIGAMSGEDMAECKGYRTRTCKDSIPLSSSEHLACVAALFFGNYSEVVNLCNIEYIMGGVEPQLLEASETEVLAVNISSFLVKCGDTTSTFKGCKYCIIVLDCRCSLTTEYYFVAPRIGKCNSQTVSTKVLHPVNMATVHYFGGERVKRELQGQTLFEEKLHLPTPQVKLFEHPYSNSIVSDSKSPLNLRQVANAVRMGKPVYNSLAERILDGDVEIIHHWWSVPGMMDLTNLILTIVCCLFSLCLFCKFRELHGYVHLYDASDKASKRF